MRRLWLLLLGLLPLLMLPAATASALSCVPYENQLSTLPVIVRGRVTAVTRLNPPPRDSAIPELDPDYRVSVAADRYYRGQGVVNVEILWDSSWDNPPPKVGWDVTLGMHPNRDGALRFGPCTLKFYHGRLNPYMEDQLKRIEAQLGPGTPPTDAHPAEPAAAPRGVWLLWSSFLLFGGLIVGFRMMKR